MQKRACEALDYTLLSLGADRPENYGNPELLLRNDVLLDVIPLLTKIAEVDASNQLAKCLALNLLWDIYNFASLEGIKQHNHQKAESVCRTVVAYEAIYQKLMNYDDRNVQKYAQRLIQLIESPL
ncbi:MAG: hypothetical protein ABI700_22330 [Chloroflexota bacterium]